MNPFRADLHCHSSCSDGTLKPLELISLAVQKGLQGLSITDHDTIDAYTDELFQEAHQQKLLLISGVEFSTVLQDKSVHLLGYNFSLKSPEIVELCQRHKVRRKKRYQAILKLLEKAGMPLSEEDLLKVVRIFAPSQNLTTIGRPHIAYAMMQQGYVQTIQEAFKKYLGENSPCYVQGDSITPEETIEALHRAGGVAIIAHPHLIKDSKTLLALLEMNFDGIECFYAKFPAKDHQRWLKIAKQRQWLITGGSDFHGENKPMIPLGCSWIDEDLFKRLQSSGVK